MWQFDLSTLNSLNLGKERSVPVALEPGNPGSSNAQTCCCGRSWAENSVGWVLVTAAFSKREHCWHVLELPGSPSALLCLGRRGFPGTRLVWPWGRLSSGVGVEVCCVLASDSPSDPQEPQQWVCRACFSSASKMSLFLWLWCYFTVFSLNVI